MVYKCKNHLSLLLNSTLLNHLETFFTMCVVMEIWTLNTIKFNVLNNDVKWQIIHFTMLTPSYTAAMYCAACCVLPQQECPYSCIILKPMRFGCGSWLSYVLM